VAIATFGFAAFLIQSFGAVDRYPPKIAKLYHAQLERSPYRCSVIVRITDYKSEMCRVNDVKGGNGILLIGDSHADQLDEILGRLGKQRNRPVYLTTRNCKLEHFTASGYCGEAIFREIVDEAKDKDITTVFSVNFMSPSVKASSLTPRVEAFFRAGVSRVVLVLPTPFDASFSPEVQIAALARGQTFASPYTLSRHEDDTRLQRQALAAVASNTGAEIIDPGPYICPNSCIFERDGKPTYLDDNHVTPAGAALLEPMFATALDHPSE
jgi:hypothetical protein